MILSNMKNASKTKKRVGRGTGSGMGKTSTRGHKGYGSRAGSTKRYTYEGGQNRLFKMMPTRGFTRGRFKKEIYTINLSQIEKYYEDKEVVSFETLKVKGLAPNSAVGIKILGDGELKKKVTIEATHFTKSAKEKLDKSKISYKVLKPVNGS